jgi:hypothetical protein
MWSRADSVLDVLNQVRRHGASVNAVFKVVSERLFVAQCLSNSGILVHVRPKCYRFGLGQSAVQIQINTLKNVFVRKLNLSHWLID